MLKKQNFNMSQLYNKILIMEMTIHFLENKIKRLEDKINYLEDNVSDITPVYSPQVQNSLPSEQNTTINDFNIHRENAILEDDFLWEKIE